MWSRHTAREAIDESRSARCAENLLRIGRPPSSKDGQLTLASVSDRGSLDGGAGDARWSFTAGASVRPRRQLRFARIAQTGTREEGLAAHGRAGHAIKEPAGDPSMIEEVTRDD